MKIVVTGASGFVGDAVCRLFVRHGHDVIACANKNGLRHGLRVKRTHIGSLNDGRFASLLAAEKPDCVVHCAGSASVGASIANPSRDYECNVALTSSIYASIVKHSPKSRVVFMSSAAVYGQPETLPITESTPCNPISPYGHHKLQCEHIGRWCHREHGLSVVNLRIFSAYGPGLAKQVLWDIFQKSQSHSFVNLSGDGTETRDLVYVEDIARLVENIAGREHIELDTINVATGQTTTIRNLAETFLETLEYRGRLEFSGIHGAGTPRFWSADGCTLSRFGLQPSVSLANGLRRYAIWLRTIEGESDSNRVLARAG